MNNNNNSGLVNLFKSNNSGINDGFNELIENNNFLKKLNEFLSLINKANENLVHFKILVKKLNYASKNNVCKVSFKIIYFDLLNNNKKKIINYNSIDNIKNNSIIIIPIKDDIPIDSNSNCVNIICKKILLPLLNLIKDNLSIKNLSNKNLSNKENYMELIKLINSLIPNNMNPNSNNMYPNSNNMYPNFGVYPNHVVPNSKSWGDNPSNWGVLSNNVRPI
jgi:hypothetical protein